MSAGGAGGAASSSAAISNSPASAYALYRATGLGKAFLESLGEMYQEQEMTNDQVIQSTLTFDKVSRQQGHLTMLWTASALSSSDMA